MRYDEICLQIIISTVLVSTDPCVGSHPYFHRGSWDISSFFTANPLHLHHNFTWIWWSPDVWPVNIIQHPKGKATNARHQDVPMIFSWRRFTHLWTHWKKMNPPTCWWSTHVNLPYYQCILWLVALMIQLYSFQPAKIKWTPHCNPIFFAWLLSFHHIFLLEPPMAQFQNKTYPSKSLVRSTHVKPLFL